MSIKLDLNILPIYRREGQSQGYLPGVHIATAPRRAARGRKNDQLIIYLDVVGNLRLSHEQQIKLLEGAAKSFYNTAGSLTTALRTVVEALNEVILRRNLHGGQPITAFLNLCVLRDDKLFIAQSGDSHSFLFSASGLDYFRDPEEAGRGLGVGRTPSIKYFQFDLAHRSMYLIAPRVPATWDQQTIQSAYGQPMPVAARHFYEDAQTEFSGILIEARSGSSLLKVLPTNEGIIQQAPPRVAQSPSPQPSVSPPQQQPPVSTSVETAPAIENNIDQPAELSETGMHRLRTRAEQAFNAIRPQSTPTNPAPEATPQPPATAPLIEHDEQGDVFLDDLTPDERAALKNAAAPTGKGFVKKIAESSLNMLRGTGRLLSRLLPDEDALRIPDWIMAMIAILVPLVFGVIAFVVYTNVGRTQLYDTYYQQALVASQIAAAEGEGPETRGAWDLVILLVDKTELYNITPETEAIRLQAQGVLDDLEGIQRLVFTPAIVGLLAPTIRVEEMVIVGDDLYLLDINSGSVFRAWKTGTGDLEMDSTFQCGPGQYGSLIVSQLIDVVALSKFNDMAATVLAMDSNGNLVYCVAGSAPTAVALEPPDSLWGKPVAMTLDDGDLYILDPLTNAVWVYTGENETFVEKPRFFFAAEVPSLQSAVDMVVNGEDLFLLHEEGSLTHCVFNNLQAAPTTCEETIFDAGAGAPSLAGAVFGELARRLPPDPALFFLDTPSQSVYMFGVRLHFERQYRASSALADGEATAFAVSENRAIFIAIGNKIFRSTIP